jgi:hypothetical protein
MKNGIKYLVAGLVATGLTVSSYAAGPISVNWGAGDVTEFTDVSGTALPVGDLVLVGTFTVAPTDGQSTLANFVTFGTGHSGDGALPAGYSSDGLTASDAGFAHTQMYLVVVNATTIGAATQEGIYTVSDVQNPAWKFPATTDVPSLTTIDVEDLNSSPGSQAALNPGADIVFGSGIDASGNVRLANLVPEPSTYLLVGTGLLGLLGLRRRS